jgi:hypothetical protein
VDNPLGNSPLIRHPQSAVTADDSTGVVSKNTSTHAAFIDAVSDQIKIVL